MQGVAETCNLSEESHALALDRRVILELIKFLRVWIRKPPRGFNYRLPPSFPDAVNLAGWLGLRTGEAAGMQYDHITKILPGSREDKFDRECHKLVVPTCKTDTKLREGRLLFFTEFHEGVEGCPAKSWSELCRLRCKKAKSIFHWPDGSAISRTEFNDIVRAFMDDFGQYKGYKREVTKRLSWYTFRISLFVYLGLNCDLSVKSIRALGGWSDKSKMPAHYQAKGRYYQGLNASIKASNMTDSRANHIDVDALLDKKWRGLLQLDH